MMKRIFLLLLTAAMLLPLAACAVDAPPDAGTTDPEITTGADELIETLALIVGSKSDYVVCRPDKNSEAVITAARELILKLKAKTGAELRMTTDWLMPDADPPELEILIGATCREESQAELATLKAAGFSIKIVGKKLIIVGGTDEATVDGVNHFIKNVVDKLPDGSTELTLSSDTVNYLYAEEYRIKTINILGTPIDKYSVVLPEDYNASEYRTSVFLREHIKKNCGVVLPLIYDNESAEHEIRIGRTVRSSAAPTGQAYRVSASGGSFEIAAASMYAYVALQKYLTGELFSPSEKEIAIDEGFSSVGDVTDTLRDGAENVLSRSGELRVMFNNMYGNCQAIHPRPQRQQQLGELYAQYLPDVIGLQECNPQSRGGNRGIDTILRKLGYTEVASSDTNYTPLFYRSEVLELVEGGYSKYEDGKGDKSKSYTWGVFRVKNSGKLFAALSTHYWWKSIDGTDNEARLADAAQMMSVVKLIEEKYGCAVITGGDFNCNKNSEPYGAIISSGYTDAARSAEKREQVKSHHSYPTYDEELKLYDKPVMPDMNVNNSIDHILIKNAEKLEVKLYDVVTDLYSLLSTDHCPIYIDLNIK